MSTSKNSPIVSNYKLDFTFEKNPDGWIDYESYLCTLHHREKTYVEDVFLNHPDKIPDNFTIQTVKHMLGGETIDVLEEFDMPANDVMHAIKLCIQKFQHDHRVFYTDGTKYYQSLRWGPHCKRLYTRPDRVTCYRRISESVVPDEWYTPDMRWVNSQYEYLARSKYRETWAIVS